MTVALIMTALAMGFFGSPHCLGMCGGIVTAFGLSMQGVSNTKKNLLIATYHIGRLSSYALLGVFAGLIGTAIFAPFMHNSLPRIILGGVLILIGLSMLGMPLLNHLEKLGMKLWQSMSPIRQKVFPINSFPKALMAGLLWGFLPCGLVYGALMMAVVGHSVSTGALLMFVFGLGTIPMLVVTQKTVAVIQQQIGKFRLHQVNGAIMMLSGVAIIAIPMAMKSLHGGHGHHGHAQHTEATSTTSQSHHHSHDDNMHHSMPHQHEHHH